MNALPAAVDPNDLLLYARVVEDGSFSRAGERLGLPKSTVSRRVAALESALGERLLLRTTRRLTVTDFGHGVLAHAQQVAEEVAATQALAQHRQAAPSGRLRLSMPGDLAQGVFARLLADFAQRHPAVVLDLDLSPRRVDLIGENIDLAIRAGELPDDASLAARRLGVSDFGLFASPGYLARRGTPRHPDELPAHDALMLRQRSGEPLPWPLQRGDERWDGQPVARAMANSPTLLTELARAGSGIAMVPLQSAEAAVADGSLRAVLPDWRLPGSPLWAVFPGRRLMPARTRAFLDALQHYLEPARCAAEGARLQAATLGPAEGAAGAHAAVTGAPA
ncbi:LysR family transcriptional regulator [Piscinibacter sakaiensis]|uniref:Transcriptional regulator, LysR family n=1 Tax=Piscinibacter sakaiensis TaxID=1547922 RepID=A0A0K8P506_PISS1|nr:LysR family transcriptional regulator [Piscinibacter sakaiensis]GAP37788.1 transcriptional regulator, LysR family [Piscinibacter sakaiensis]